MSAPPDATTATSRTRSKIRLSYSLDGGARWTRFATLGPAGSLTGWSSSIPVTADVLVLVRIQLLDTYGRVIASDRSDRPFTIFSHTH